MGIVERFWKRIAGHEAAARAELEGDLPRAARLWAKAGAMDEVARVLVLRGDGEADPRQRLPHYVQAAAAATRGSAAARAATSRKATLIVLLAQEGGLSPALRRDVLAAAVDLEQLGDLPAAAEAYALAGDTEGEARSLAAGGDVERLDDLLARDQRASADARRTHERAEAREARVAAGERREALAIADASPDDARARERAARIRSARVKGPIAHLTLRGAPLALVLGDDVVIGRDGAIAVASAVLSRRHARVFRDDATGAILVEDLASHNGTLLRGQRLAGPIAVGDGLSLSLGGEVPLELAPSRGELGVETIAVEVGGARYLAPLARGVGLPVGAWRLEPGEDGWIELVTAADGRAFAGVMELAPRVTLLRGDALAAVRGGAAVVLVG